MIAYCSTALLRRRTETPGEIVTDQPPADAEEAAALSSSASICAPGLKIAGGAPESWANEVALRPERIRADNSRCFIMFPVRGYR